MKLNHLIKASAAAMLFASGIAHADAEGAFHMDQPGLYDSSSTSGDVYDPVAAAFPGNIELYAGHATDSAIVHDNGLTSLDSVNVGSPESEYYGCI